MASSLEPAETSSNPTSGEVLLEYLRRQVAELQQQAPRVRDNEPDSVHQMRMSARRLRAVLRSARSILEPGLALVDGSSRNLSCSELRAELKWLSGVLGKARDPEVIRDRLTALMAEQPDALLVGPAAERIQQALAAAGREAREEVLKAFGSDRYARLVEALESLPETPLSGDKAERPARKGLAKVAKKDVRRLRRKVAAVGPRKPGDAGADSGSDPDSRNVAFHDVRKAAKRVRYIAEAASLAKAKSADRIEEAAHTIQKILGQHQDSVVAREQLLRLGTKSGLGSKSDGDSDFTFGRLHALEERRADEAEKEFFKAWKGFP
ncbi:CHAD domain-containing protein [Arthrobacter rhizosphaerae]|uniref:CHAD domain-containing protein n=1 Tax=Arthrobacter rhizosphaerae TaxID=2855490 RepID=UPI001FF21D4D|nr:CHAD domain-containing protein [Arthrobacter rhizosphaerae]